MQVIAEVSEDLGEAMTGINCDGLVTRFADREGGNMPAAKKPRMESYGDKGLAGTAFWGPIWSLVFVGFTQSGSQPRRPTERSEEPWIQSIESRWI